MRILFVSRAYPPIIGGIENQNYALSMWLAKYTPTTTIANRYGKKILPFFFLWATVRTLFTLPFFDILLLGDGVLAPLGWITKLIAPKKAVVSILHGLDITYPLPLYQKLWVRFFFLHLDGFIAVSSATKRLAQAYGVPQDKIFVIPNGIEHISERSPSQRADLERLLNRNLSHSIVLLSLGRLVPRKGVAWFLEYVFPTLPNSFIYCIAGDGPERVHLEQLISDYQLEQRVFLLGKVDQATLELLLDTADLFIQPNRPIKNDIEGFGIAVLEASARGVPVIASRLEGLEEAITHEKNGFLVTPLDVNAFRDCILTHQHSKALIGPQLARYTLEHFSWSRISKEYTELLADFQKNVTDYH